jgi:hypothetical protein
MVRKAKLEAMASSALSTASERTAMLPVRIPTTSFKIMRLRFDVKESAAARDAKSKRKARKRSSGKRLIAEA